MTTHPRRASARHDRWSSRIALQPLGPSTAVRFDGGIFERYEWTGVVRHRADGNVEVTRVEAADFEAFQAGESRGGGTGIVIRCGYDGTR